MSDDEGVLVSLPPGQPQAKFFPNVESDQLEFLREQNEIFHAGQMEHTSIFHTLKGSTRTCGSYTMFYLNF